MSRRVASFDRHENVSAGALKCTYRRQELSAHLRARSARLRGRMDEREALVDLHRPAIQVAIRQTCAKWHASGSEGDDLSQHLWCVVLDHDARVLRRFEQRSTMSSYLFPVLMRAAGKWFEKRTLVNRREAPAGDTYALFGPLLASDQTTDASPTADHRGRLRRHLMRLRRFDRLLLRLRYECGESIRDIASLLDMSPKAVERRIARVIARLRRALAAPKCGLNEQSGQGDSGRKQASKQASASHVKSAGGGHPFFQRAR